MKRIKIILGLVLFASVSTFAQSPRIKLNQITKDTVKGSVLISSPSDSGMVYSRDFYVAYGADTVLILYGDTLASTSGIISSVLSDGVTITGDGSVGNPLKVDTATVISTIKGLVDTLTNRGYLTANQTITLSGDVTGSGTTAITATVVDDSHDHIISNVDNLQDSLTAKANVTELSNYLLTSNYIVDSTRLNTTGDTAYYYQNGVLIGTKAIAGGGGTSYNNISETADTVFIDKYLNVDTSTLYVDATNNRVGIGTSSPSVALEIKRSFANGDGIRLDNNGNGYFQVTNSASGFQPIFQGQNGSSNASALIFRGLQNLDTETAATVRFIARQSNNSSAVTSANPFQFTNGSTNVFEIEADGGIIIPSLLNASTGNTMYYNTTSDEISYSSSSIRFKNDIEDLPIGLNELMMLKPTRYTYIPDGKKDYGFIAEQVYDVGLTEFVTFNQDNQIEGLKDKYFMILNTKAIQEQQAIIETQATEIDQLKTLITDLTNRLTILENK